MLVVTYLINVTKLHHTEKYSLVGCPTELMTVIQSNIQNSKVFINSFNLEKLRKYFEVFGRVQDAVVMKDPVSRRSRGFGFITFDDVASVDHALAQDVHTIDSRRVGEPCDRIQTVLH